MSERVSKRRKKRYTKKELQEMKEMLKQETPNINIIRKDGVVTNPTNVIKNVKKRGY